MDKKFVFTALEDYDLLLNYAKELAGRWAKAYEKYYSQVENVRIDYKNSRVTFNMIPWTSGMHPFNYFPLELLWDDSNLEEKAAQQKKEKDDRRIYLYNERDRLKNSDNEQRLKDIQKELDILTFGYAFNRRGMACL